MQEAKASLAQTAVGRNVKIPRRMKLVYFWRHVLQRPDLFARSEERIRQRVAERYAGSPRTSPVELTRIAHIDNFNLTEFKKEGGFATPFLIKGLLGAHRLHWNVLRDKFGDCIVPVHQAAKLGDDWQYQPTRLMTLANAMRGMEAGCPLSVVSSTRILLDHNDLLTGLAPKMLSAKFGVDFVRYEMFIGGPDTGSAFHCEIGGNFFHMLYGRKRWVLVSSQDSFAMRPSIGRKTYSAIFGSPVTSETSAHEQHQSCLYDIVTKYSVTLEPGDVLYVPSLWWHEVKNLEPTVGIPLRFWGGKNRTFLLLLAILSGFGLKYLPRALIAKLTGNPKWLMTDTLTQDTWGGSRPRGSTALCTSSEQPGMTSSHSTEGE